MQYTADELRGAGTLIKNQLLAGGEYTFYLYRPENSTGQSPSLSGSGYFTFETLRDNKGFYPLNTSPLASGSKANVSGSNALIESPYIFSYELNTNGSTPQTSSFTFVPDNTIGIGKVMFRATGDYDMDVSPIEGGCGEVENYNGGPSYPTTLDFALGADTGTIGCLLDPLSVPDRFIITWDGDIVIDTGYLSTPFGVSDQYNVGGTARNSFTSQLAGRTAPEGGTYPLPPGGSGNNIISSDGYPEVFVKDAPTLVNFTKDNSTSSARVDVYAPMTGTGWNVRVDCPI